MQIISAKIITPINVLEKLGGQIHFFYEKNSVLPVSENGADIWSESFMGRNITFSRENDRYIRAFLFDKDTNIVYTLSYKVGTCHSLSFFKDGDFYGSFKLDDNGDLYDVVSAKKISLSENENFLEKGGRCYVPVKSQTLCGNGADFTAFAGQR